MQRIIQNHTFFRIHVIHQFQLNQRQIMQRNVHVLFKANTKSWARWSVNKLVSDDKGLKTEDLIYVK